MSDPRDFTPEQAERFVELACERDVLSPDEPERVPFKPTPMCPRCHEWLWEWEKKPHVCPTRYEVICEDYDSEHVFEVYATDIEAAIEKWAEEYDREDTPDIANGMGDVWMEVKVRAPGDTIWTKWRVCGEWTAEYRAEYAT